MKKNKFARQTKRLALRPLKLSDYKIWKNSYLKSGSLQNRWDGSKKADDQLEMQSFKKLLKYQSDQRKTENFCDYAIFDKKTGEYIGMLCLMNFVRSVTQSAFVGYSLFNQYWGLGYANEALLALIDIAFNDHKLHRIVAGIEPQNKKSIQLVKKIGFRKEGVSKKIVLLRDQWQDLVQYALTCEDVGIQWQGSIQRRFR